MQILSEFFLLTSAVADPDLQLGGAFEGLTKIVDFCEDNSGSAQKMRYFRKNWRGGGGGGERVPQPLPCIPHCSVLAYLGDQIERSENNRHMEGCFLTVAYKGKVKTIPEVIDLRSSKRNSGRLWELARLKSQNGLDKQDKHVEM